jgi:SAM-dependent methyltransferase
VVGTDVSAAQLEVASEHSPFPARCTWVQTPAEALEAAGGPFDLVYSRFLLQYTADPDAVLREMVRVLAPGGLLVVEDALVATFRFVPPRDNVRGADNWWFQLQERNGASPKFPERMPRAVQALDLTIERFESHQPVSFDREALRMHILGSQQIYPAIVAAGIAKRAATERQLRMLQSAMEDGETYVELYRVLQIAARKPL